MPRGDGTGPMGMGAMTGRAAGYCAGSGMPGYANPIPGRGGPMDTGFGGGRGGLTSAGFGGGRGRRRMFFATGQPGWMRFGGGATFGRPDPEGERQALKNRADALQSALDDIKRRLADMGSNV